MFNKLRNIGFTKQDIIIISFLIVSFIGGLVIKFSGWEPTREFDYSASDKEFEQNIKSSFSGLDSKPLSEEQNLKLQKLNSIKDSLSLNKPGTKLTPKETALNKKINLNTASEDELAMLPGIGKSIAARIFAYRQQYKSFKSPAELMEVKGIGEKKFEKLKNYITIGE